MGLWDRQRRMLNRTNEESSGFKFAVTLLAAFGTIVYAAFIYFQKNAISVKYFDYFISLFSPIIMLVSFLLLYIFIKGASMELQDAKLKRRAGKFAEFIYSVAFLSFFFIIFQIILKIISLIAGFEINSSISQVLSILNFIIVVIFFWPNIVHIREYFINLRFIENPANLITAAANLITAAVILIMSSVILLLFYSATLDLPLLQGDVKVNMNSTYYKDGTPIPVSIDVTGRNPGLSIYLYNVSHKIDNINITLNAADTVKSETLIGNAFDSGKYYVFINTSSPNMTKGYYKLAFSRINESDGYKYGKSFYLLNAR